jgi:hypothetical protein
MDQADGGHTKHSKTDRVETVAREEVAAVVRPRTVPIAARIGDALASRNVHAAVYDALRLCTCC